MDAHALQDAAAALLAHRARLRSGPALAPRGPLPAVSAVLPPHWLPADVHAAYALQDAWIRQAGAVGGWKVGGATAPEPNCAPVPARVLVEAPAALDWDIAPDTEFECEIAFTFARDLPARAQPYTQDEVAAAIGATRPSVELLAPRFAEPQTAGERLAVLADGLGCGALLLGTPMAGFQEVDCAAQPVQVLADGAVVLERTGGNAARRLLPLVCWLANHLAQRGQALRAGQTVTTGSWTGQRPWGATRELRVAFAGIGEVLVRPHRPA